MISLDTIGLFLLMAGFALGLGAVTVIDLHGFLGRKSSYWTEATTRTHKVTKPLIWAGMILAIVGGFVLFRGGPFEGTHLFLSVAAIALVANGLLLSFSVSPYLLAREREGRASDTLPAPWQAKIAVSLVVSDIGWWGSLALVAHWIALRM